jgi:hypothetical protein
LLVISRVRLFRGICTFWDLLVHCNPPLKIEILLLFKILRRCLSD